MKKDLSKVELVNVLLDRVGILRTDLQQRIAEHSVLTRSELDSAARQEVLHQITLADVQLMKLGETILTLLD